MTDGCPTCGREVRVVTDGGTSHYEPVQPEGLSEEECFESVVALDYMRKMADGFSAAAKSAQAKLEARLARLRGESGMSAFLVTCPRCGAVYIMGVVGTWSFPAHTCPKKPRGVPSSGDNSG